MFDIHRANLVIPTNDILKYDELMAKGHFNLKDFGLPTNGNIITWSAVFDDGKMFDLRVNTSDDDVWCEGVLLDDDGNTFREVAVSDVKDVIYESSYEFNVGEEIYAVYIISDGSPVKVKKTEPNYKDIVGKIKKELDHFYNWYERDEYIEYDQFEAEHTLDRVKTILNNI